MLNDKLGLPIARQNLRAFSAFLATASGDTITSKIYPQVVFIINRSSRLIGLIADLISLFQAYKIETVSALEQWTTELLSDELLVTVAKRDEISAYLKSVREKCSPEM